MLHTPGVRVGKETLNLAFVGVLSLFDAPPQVRPGCAVALCFSRSECSVTCLQQEPDLLIHPLLLIGVCGDLLRGSDAVDGGGDVTRQPQLYRMKLSG